MLAILLLLVLFGYSKSWLLSGNAAHSFLKVLTSSLALDLGVFDVFDATWLAEAPSTTFVKRDLVRLDETPDSLFYSSPRFAEHVDNAAVAALTAYNDLLIHSVADTQGSKVRLLDLCSSWTSHVSPEAAAAYVAQATGLGMNAQELERNPLLTRRVIQDLNIDPKLPFRNGEFDLLLIQLSIDYLTQPVALLTEAGRVLRPGGTIAISFSNRVFLTKTVGYWSGKPDIEHVEAVGDALRASKAFVIPPTALNLHLRSGSGSGKDPLFAVQATTLPTL